MQRFVVSLILFFIGLINTYAQTLSLTATLTDSGGNLLQGVHRIDFVLKNSSSNKVENWHQRKTILIRDGLIVTELGDKQQGASDTFPEELIPTHSIEISENGVVLQTISLSPQSTTISQATKTPLSIQGAKVLLSDIDQGRANDGQVLTWDNSAKSWQPKIPTGGTTTQSGVNTINLQKGDFTIEVTSPITLSSTSNKLTFGLANNTIPKNTGVPIGTIVAFFGNESRIPVPEGWLLCDGREFKKSDYQQLSDMLGDLGLSPMNTPDLRGQFLRGSNLSSEGERAPSSGDPDFSSRTGTGQKIGSGQSDEYKRHSHDFMISTKTSTGGTDAKEVSIAGTSGTQKYISFNTTDYENYIGGVAKSGATIETRPKNIAVNWIIKAKE